ncbi:MAG: excinuclease ABC subunit UvrA [Bacteroidales bacterium]|nr:excinuclease ABC subunit UvrA [Bacteroidales bacterium]
MSNNSSIIIKSATVHNLKNISLAIPRNQLIVITGVSGSGKSSLAFDTLYAEGQRRYVESLSAYARQFMGRINKPEVEYIKGIPPAIAIEQKVNTRNPRSTVGTSTEIYDYLKLLFARIGQTISPISGTVVRRHSVSDVVNAALKKPAGTRLAILAPALVPADRNRIQFLKTLHEQGFSRIEFAESIYKFDELLMNEAFLTGTSDFYLVIDRLNNEDSSENLSRMADSVQTAFYEGHGTCVLRYYQDNESTIEEFSDRFEADGIQFEIPIPDLFGFNNPMGACKRCEGYGSVIGIDEELVVPDKNLSIYQDAIACWKGEKMAYFKDQLIEKAAKFKFPIHKPYFQLSEEEKETLWNGNRYFEGLNDFFQMLEKENYKIQYRVMLSRFRGKTVCPECKGTRLKKEASWVKVAGKSIHDLVLMPVAELKQFFLTIQLSDYDQQLSKRLLLEINSRLGFLNDVGLGYLTLNRLSSSLSGGESQRINLATSLGSSLVGSLYILDEPSIGLHSRDTDLLIKVLKNLKRLGNTVIVVEHDEEIMRTADQLIDIGPRAGRFGGEIVFQGTPDQLSNPEASLTAAYLTGQLQIPLPTSRRKWNNFIEIHGARENNLKNITLKIPLQVMTVITGVSGSGKSSLVRTILYPALKKELSGYSGYSGKFDFLSGDKHLIQDIEFIDQNTIGRSSRSNPVTYMKAYDEVRKLFADQQLSTQMGFKPSHFSFNVPGGRCEECQGEGFIEVEMQFMADITLECESCKGKRFKDEVLEVLYRGKSIYDILTLSVSEAIAFFSEVKGNTEDKIIQKIKPLDDVGLGYVKLGQSSSTLSGGESQRLKLASFLVKENAEKPMLFIFDEPTTGLHFHDVNVLLKAFQSLIARGNTILIIEHNADVIKTADWVIDLGPEGGNLGGNLVFEGTPEDLIKCQESYTGKYLFNKINVH